MTTEEFSTQFDVLWNNISSNQAPGLNEYEKSIFLTKAQNMLVKEYFNHRTDGSDGGFDGSEKRQYDFSSLIRTENLFYLNTYKTRIDSTEKLDQRSKVYLFPKNYFLSVNELLSDEYIQYVVQPLDYAEYQRLMLKPYSFPVKRAAWRIITDKKNCNYVHEDVEGNDLGDNVSDTDYKILSSWADQKRSMSISFFNAQMTTVTLSDPVLLAVDRATSATDKCSTYSGYVWTDSDGLEYTLDICAATRWIDNVYTVAIAVSCTDGEDDFEDDEQFILALQAFFYDLKEGNLANLAYNAIDNYLVKACSHLDGLALANAPSKQETFSYAPGDEDATGRTFTTSVVSIPMAEIIGKFKSAIPQYQMRYVRSLTPIILEDLTNYGTDITIEGLADITECILPEETHEEILERAVTLAKVAWAGGTVTQAAAAAAQRQ